MESLELSKGLWRFGKLINTRFSVNTGMKSNLVFLQLVGGWFSKLLDHLPCQFWEDEVWGVGVPFADYRTGRESSVRYGREGHWRI